MLKSLKHTRMSRVNITDGKERGKEGVVKEGRERKKKEEGWGKKGIKKE